MAQTQPQKREDILQAALELFAEHGFHNAPMAQLARRADVAVGSIYRYFKDKDELIHELYKEVDDALESALAREVEPTASTQRQFVHLITSLTRYLVDHPHVFKFLEQYYNSPFGIEKKREKLDISGRTGRQSTFGRFFSSAADGVIKPLSGHVLQALAFGPVTFLLREANSGLTNVDESMIEALAEGCWNAIRQQ